MTPCLFAVLLYLLFFVFVLFVFLRLGFKGCNPLGGDDAHVDAPRASRNPFSRNAVARKRGCGHVVGEFGRSAIQVVDTGIQARKVDSNSVHCVKSKNV